MKSLLCCAAAVCDEGLPRGRLRVALREMPRGRVQKISGGVCVFDFQQSLTTDDATIFTTALVQIVFSAGSRNMVPPGRVAQGDGRRCRLWCRRLAVQIPFDSTGKRDDSEKKMWNHQDSPASWWMDWDSRRRFRKYSVTLTNGHSVKFQPFAKIN